MHPTRGSVQSVVSEHLLELGFDSNFKNRFDSDFSVSESIFSDSLRYHPIRSDFDSIRGLMLLKMKNVFEPFPSLHDCVEKQHIKTSIQCLRCLK